MKKKYLMISKLAKEFNKYFVNVGSKLAEDISPNENMAISVSIITYFHLKLVETLCNTLTTALVETTEDVIW